MPGFEVTVELVLVVGNGAGALAFFGDGGLFRRKASKRCLASDDSERARNSMKQSASPRINSMNRLAASKSKRGSSFWTLEVIDASSGVMRV